MATTPSDRVQAYRFHAHEPALMVELYFPKKARYQGPLYEALVDAFTWPKVQKHFLDPIQRQDIVELLKEYPHVGPITDERVRSMTPLLRGYSTYEVDGVFKADEVGERVIEERTQVVRIIFIPPVRQMAMADRTASHADSDREALHLATMFLAATEPERDVLKADEARHRPWFSALEQWEQDVGLFVFGYLAYLLCRTVGRMSRDGLQDPEEEIWVSSLWSFSLNRLTPTVCRAR